MAQLGIQGIELENPVNKKPRLLSEVLCLTKTTTILF